MVPTVCFSDFMYLVKQYLEICIYYTYRLLHYLYNGLKFSAWIVRLLYWVREKQSTSMFVLNANLWWCCSAVDADWNWNNTVCQHSVLPCLSSCNQDRMCISRTRIFVCPMPTYVHCHVSLLSMSAYVVCYAYLVYCAYNYTEWPM